MLTEQSFAKRISKFSKEYSVIVIFVVLCLVFGLISKNFFSASNAITVLRQISMLCIMCCGCSLVIISGGIDLSCGSVASVSGVFWALVMVNFGAPQWMAVVVALVAGAFFGLINGLLITKTNMNPMIGTLGMSTILQGAAYLICNGGTPIYGLPEGAKLLGQGYWAGIPIPIYIMAICLLIHAFILFKTRLGRAMIATGSNAESTRLSGINSKKIQVIAYTLSGFFTAIGGVVLMSRVNSGQPKAGEEFQMNVITACVVGGISLAGGAGNTLKLLFGCLIVGVINNGLTIVQVSEYWQMIARGGILIFAVAIDAISMLRAEKAKRSIKHS